MKLTKSEKKLLTLIGKNPSLSRSQLQHQLKYKRASTVSNKKRDLKEAEYIMGPYYHINLNVVGTNNIYNILAEIRFDPEQYELVFQLIKCINCWEWIFPTIQGDALFVFFRSNYYTYLTRLLTMLRDTGLIEYKPYSSQNRWFVNNPDFFGSIYPQVNPLFDDAVIDLAYPKKREDIQWRFIDLKMMQYLQVKTCNIGEIQKMEKRIYGRFWRRNQIRYSIEKIINAGIAEREHYNISPYPRDKCYAFLLLIGGDKEDVIKFCVNFGRKCRMYKAFTMCNDIGFVWCWTSPQLGPVLMDILDDLHPRIHARCLQLKSTDCDDTLKKSFNDEHFDYDKQRWTFPFKVYKGRIEEILEKRKE